MKKFKIEKKYTTLLILIIFVIGILYLDFVNAKTQNMKVAFLDVGQGDSIFIQAPNGKQMLVDGGRGSRVLPELGKVMPFGDRTIDVVIGTHPDADHIGGLVDVLENYDVENFIESGGSSKSKIYTTLQKDIQEKNIVHLVGRADTKIILDKENGVYFDILYPDVKNVSKWETNDGSIVGKLVYGNTSVMLTADSPIEKELYLIRKNPEVLDADILKLGHHGSRTSSSVKYLQTVGPTLAIISAGENNQYGHPHKEVIDNLKKLDIPYMATSEKGSIVCTSDAVHIYCD